LYHHYAGILQGRQAFGLDVNVAKEYSKQLSYDYTEVFASIFCPASLYLIISLTAKQDFKIQSLDILSAFTYRELNKVIYMR